MTRPRILVGALVLAALVGCTTAPLAGGRSGGTTGQAATPVLDAAATASALATLGTKPGKDLKPVRLGPGLVPPTNRWFSGLVFGDKPQPVFPLPLSFGLDAAGFGFGVPDVKTTAKTIMGGYRPAVQVGVAGVSGWTVTGYDELSVTMEATGASGAVTIAQGSPFVTFASPQGATLSTSVPFERRGDAWVAPDGSVGLVAEGADVSGTSVTVRPGGHVIWFAVPLGTDPGRIAALASPITGTDVAYSVGDSVTTRLTYRTASGRTAFGVLPHQQARLKDATCDLGSFATLLGSMKLCSGESLTFETPSVDAFAALDLGRLSEPEKAELRAQVTTDVAAAKPYPADTYFGGKALYRDAQLYLIAKQVGAPEASAIKEKVTQALLRWARPTGCAAASEFCFTYDSTNKGIVGLAASFGSDEYNDHHFHYGYFLYAAGALASDDPGLVDQLSPVMNLLAADIASSVPGEFPVRRNFDAYSGHSWASGTSPFADGNNQESSAEAVHAWAGLRLWADAAGNQALAAEASWMQSLEAATAQVYYLAFDESDPVYAGYEHRISPLIFGGKRDYATWFSPERAAALGIQLLPMSPSSGYLKTDAPRIAANLAEGTGSIGYRQKFGDYLLMYAALAGESQRTDALAEARSFPTDLIDDGTTKTYLLAYLMSVRG